MTNIIPPRGMPAMPTLSRNAQPAAKGSDAEFASLTAQPLGGAGEEPRSSGHANEAALRTAIAHVFNAYGFFTADGDAEAPVGEVGDVEAAGDDPAPTSPQPTGGEEPGPTDHRPQATPARQASERAFAVHAGDRSPPGPRSSGHGPANDSTKVDPYLRALQNRLENAPELPEKASAKAAAHRSERSEQRDRVTLKIAENTVELIGRLSNLDETERQRLLDEVNSLLAAHGLSLSNATLNGETFSQALKRPA